MRWPRRFPCAQKPVLFSFLDAGIPRQKAGVLQGRLELPVELDERPGDAQPDGFGLTLQPSPADPQEDIQLALGVGQEEGLSDDVFMRIEVKVGGERTGSLVHDQRGIAFPGTQEDPGH